MKYEEAVQDANLAHNVSPNRPEAYHALGDFLLALNEHEKAQQVLNIINTPGADPMIKNMYDMISKVVNDKKQGARSKQQTKTQKQIQLARNECQSTLKSNIAKDT